MLNLRLSVPLSCLLLAAAPLAAREASVRLPEGFGPEAQVHGVQGYSPRRFQQPLVFGPYSARIQEGGDTRGGRAAIGRADLREGERRHAFLLTTVGQPVLDVECTGQALALGEEDEDGGWSLDLGALAGPVLECSLHASLDDPGRRLVLMQRARGLEGHFDAPWGRLRLASLHGYAGSRVTSPEPTGYVIEGEEGALMVVDLLNAGRVLLAPGLDDRRRAWLAAVAAALLLSPPVEPG